MPDYEQPCEHTQVHNREQASRRLNIGRVSLDKLIASGELRSFTVGTRRLITEVAIRDFITAREQMAG